MKEIFASMYEWFGLMMPYSDDMADYLRGWDITCTKYDDPSWYLYIGWTMLAITALAYALQYHIIDSSNYSKKKHWWLTALLLVILNFLIPFSITFNTVSAGTDFYCKELDLQISDCVGFAFSNAIWSLLFFMLVSSVPYPRSESDTCRNTTFWKP
jgi:hypothetical protein